MLSTIFMRSPQRYKKVASFTTSAASIHALALSNDGNILASGGTDGIRLWNIKLRKQFTYANHESYGAVSCATWIKTKYGSTETLCYGTGMGYLVFIRQNPIDNHFQEITARRLGAGLEITCVAWDVSWTDAGTRIAVGMRDNVVQVLLLSTNSQLQSVFAGRLEHTVPKSIAFTQRGNIYIFGLYDGNVVKMNATDGVILSEHCYDSVIGCAAVSLKKELVVIDNATDGFTLYSLDRGDPIRHFVTELQYVHVPKQVAFGEESKIIVGGSDNGSVYLFERRTGRMLAKLAHSKTGLVQTVTTRDVGGCCIIASASPATGRKKTLIQLWTHEYGSQKSAARPEGQRMLGLIIFTVFIVLGVLGFSLQTNLLGVMLVHIPHVTYWCSRLPLQKPAQVPMPPPLPVQDPVVNVNNIEILKDLAMQLVDLANEAHKNDYENADSEARDGWPSWHKEVTNVVTGDHGVDSNLEKSVVIYL